MGALKFLTSISSWMSRIRHRSFTPYSTEIGPLDERRINTMALIEYPEWRTGRQPDVQPESNAIRLHWRVLRRHPGGRYRA